MTVATQKTYSESDIAAIEAFVATPVDYRILKSTADYDSVKNDLRYWRIVAFKDTAFELLRVPLRVDNAALLDLEAKESATGLRVANLAELAASYTTSDGIQFPYPWGRRADAKNAPLSLTQNPMGMGMNMSGAYFNGPLNPGNPDKDGLWAVTAERDAAGQYVSGSRSGTAGTVGVFQPFDPNAPQTEPLIQLTNRAAAGTNDSGQGGDVAPGERGPVTPGERGPVAPGERGPIAPGERGPVAPGERGPVAPGERGPVAPDKRSAEPDASYLTPAGIGHGEELWPIEGYVIRRELSPHNLALFKAAMGALDRKIAADGGIPLISFGSIPDGRGGTIIVGAFYVGGQCGRCANASSVTAPVNAPAVAAATGVPVTDYPEAAHHQGSEGRRPIIAKGSNLANAGRRIFMPAPR